MAGIDVNRTTTGVVLPPAVSNEIWANIQEQRTTGRVDLTQQEALRLR